MRIRSPRPVGLLFFACLATAPTTVLAADFKKENPPPKACDAFRGVKAPEKKPEQKEVLDYLLPLHSALKPPKSDNKAFEDAYKEGSIENRDHELIYVDFKSSRIEVKLPNGAIWVLHAECPILKALNDGPFKGGKAGADVLVAMASRAVEAEFGPGSQLRKDLAAGMDPDEAFAKAAQSAVDKLNSEIDKSPMLKAYLETFKIEPSQLLGMGWADRASGDGHGDVAAAFAARFTRKRARGDKPFRSFRDTVALIEKNLGSLHRLNVGLRKHPGQFFRDTGEGITVLKPGVYELLRKYPVPADLIQLGEKPEEWSARAKASLPFQELLAALRTRYGDHVNAEDARYLAEYVNLVDALAAPIYAQPPTPLPWKGKGAALSGDLIGGGAENLAELEAELLLAYDHKNKASQAAAGSRLAEQIVTGNMGKKKAHFEGEVREWLTSEYRSLGQTAPEIPLGTSADDMLAMIPGHLADNPGALQRLAKRLNSKYPGRIRLTLGPETYRGTTEALDPVLKEKLTGSLESIHKKALLLAEKKLERPLPHGTLEGIPYDVLEKALVMPKATIDKKTGQVRVQVILHGVPEKYYERLRQALLDAVAKEGTTPELKSWVVDDQWHFVP